jgi:Mrp family chromosome partitioning ATPase
MDVNEQSQSAPTASYVPRYASLPDYLHVVRRYLLMIVLIAVAGAVIGFGWAASKSERYEASTSLSFRDLSQDLAPLGVEAIPEQPPPVRAAANAELLTGPEVTRRVARRLSEGRKRKLSPQALAGAVEAKVDTRSQLVTLEASAGDPRLAAAIANEYARQARIIRERETDQRLAGVMDSLRKSISELESNPSPGADFRLGSLESQLSRVRSLDEIARPVEITERATVPDAPVSPQPARDGILGGLVGLVLGLIAAFGRDALDRRLRTARDVNSELGLPILGRVRESALGSPGLAKNGAVPMSDADFESFRVLRTGLGYLAGERSIKSVLVTSGLPNEGKSTVAMSLASAAVLAGQRVLLVEGDFRRPIFAKRMGVNATPGLSDYLRGRAQPRDIVQTVEMTAPRRLDSNPVAENGAGTPQGGGSTGLLACITAGSQAQDAVELLVTDRFEQFLDETRQVYDLVIIDSGPLLAVVDPLEVVEHVDAMIVCVRAREATRDEARSVRSVLANLPQRPACAVVTGLRSDGAEAYEYYYG